jgi:hypothetical protein
MIYLSIGLMIASVCCMIGSLYYALKANNDL